MNTQWLSKAAKRGRVRRRLSCASPGLATTRKRAECGAQFLDEYGGLLKGREMSAVGGFVPIEESRIDPLAPQSRRSKLFAGENAHGDRQSASAAISDETDIIPRHQRSS